MLDIRFKDSILNGTMCAFVSKETSHNVQTGKMFYFAQEVEKYRTSCHTYKNEIVSLAAHFPYGDINKLPYYYKFIAKAECVGVNKVRVYPNDEDGQVVGFCIDNKVEDILLTHEELGFSQYDELIEYYENLLGELGKMEGYLHIFKLVEGK